MGAPAVELGSSDDVSLCAVTPEWLASLPACLPGMWLWDWYGNDIGHHGGDGFDEGCLSFLLLMGIRDFLSIANSLAPVVRNSTLTIPHFFVTLCLSWCHSFSPPGRKLGEFPLSNASLLAPWRAVILLCICLQLTSPCPESVCPLRAWTSVHSGHWGTHWAA